ncbi:MAG TPA: hypothetical protein VIG99_14925 [Myxococcaceae bacterium]|jgi:hypothetical protein
MRVRWLALCGVAVVGLTGCPSFSTMGLARPIRKGTTQIVVAPEALALAVVNPTTGVATGAVLPQAEIAVRYGITDSFELGAKAWLLGAGLEGKIGIIQSNPGFGLDIAINPGFAYLGYGSTTSSSGLLSLSLPVMFGLNLGGHQLIVAPKVMDLVFLGGTSPVHVVLTGASVGFALKLGDELRIMPEISAVYPASVNSGGTTFTLPFQGAAVQAGLGLLIGGGRFDQ